MNSKAWFLLGVNRSLTCICAKSMHMSFFVSFTCSLVRNSLAVVRRRRVFYRIYTYVAVEISNHVWLSWSALKEVSLKNDKC